jgi:hypothetical protein
VTEDTLANFEGLRDNVDVSFEVLWQGVLCCLVLLDRILPHFASYGNVKLLQGLDVLGVFKVKIVQVRKLQRWFELRVLSRTQRDTTHECHFGGRLVAWTGFEQERA